MQNKLITHLLCVFSHHSFHTTIPLLTSKINLSLQTEMQTFQFQFVVNNKGKGSKINLHSYTLVFLICPC